MAQPTNTYDTYDSANAIRQDLSKVITNVSPEDTPFYSKCKKTKATNTYHEWMTDSLRSSGTNAHIEGDATVAEARTAPSRLGNYSQIFKNAVLIPSTGAAVDSVKKASAMAYEVMKVAAEQKLDIEKALFANNARVAGNATTARELAGVPAWLTANTVFESGNSGADPTGDGTDGRTDDGTPVAFSQARFDAAMQSIWNSGGKANSVYLSSFQMNVALGFTGNNNQRSQISADAGKVSNYMAVYLTPWGSVEFIPSRENRARDVFILQDDMWEIASLRPMKNEALAKDGDYEKRQVVSELTLVSRNEAASGAIYDNTVA